MGLCSQPLSLGGGDGDGKEGAVKEKRRAGQEPGSPSLCSSWTGVAGCGRLGLRDWCWDGAQPQREGLGFRSPSKRYGIRHRGPWYPPAEHPLGREAQPSILPAPCSCRQSSLPYVSPFLHQGKPLGDAAPSAHNSHGQRQHVCPGSRSWWWQVRDPAGDFWSTASPSPGGHRPVDSGARAPEPEVASSWMAAKDPAGSRPSQSEVPVDSHSQGLVTGLSSKASPQKEKPEAPGGCVFSPSFPSGPAAPLRLPRRLWAASIRIRPCSP